MSGRAVPERGRSTSPSSRRAWIEICRPSAWRCRRQVALLAEGVDRNGFSSSPCRRRSMSPSSRRAWIEIDIRNAIKQVKMSPSSRRAWIEIPHTVRNGRGIPGSPSSRRAWIEITTETENLACGRSPSSRRAWIEITGVLSEKTTETGRPPRGGRG